MDPATLAAAAVAFVVSALSKLGEGAAKKVGEEAGGTVFAWLKTKLGGPGQEALDDLAAEPDNADNQADLRKKIVKAMQADPAFAGELQTLLPDTPAGGDTMQQTLGAGAKANMTKGSGNTSTIG